MHTPSWLGNAIFYQIYPQSFFDTNADGIGDLNGIIEKLDYICSLGCNAIWLNPCFVSPFLDAGYDISDFYRIAPRYGTNEDMKRLCRIAHEKGLHVLLDLVPGHTAMEHPWFQASGLAEKNAYSDRYVWTDDVWEDIGDVGSVLGCIRGFSERNGACAVTWFTHQPALNYGFYQPDPAKPWQQPMSAEGPKANIEEMKQIMRFWLSLGCDGFRVDCAESLVKNDPEYQGTIRLWKQIRQFLDAEFPDAVMISEWGEPDKAIEGGFHMDFVLHCGPSHYTDLFHCDTPYFSANEAGSAAAFVEKYQETYQKADGRGLICIPSGNHDCERMSYYLTPGQQKLAFAFILAMPGAPFLYYGDEIGMRYQKDIPSKEGGYARTGSRTPMQWSAGVNAGFSSAPQSELYLPIDADENCPNVASQLADEGSLLQEVRNLIAFRQKNTALQNHGGIEFLQTGYPLVFRRSAEDQKMLVIVNPSAKACTVENVHGSIAYCVGNGASMEGAVVSVCGETVAFIQEALP